MVPTAAKEASMAKWLIVLAFALLALHFGEAMAAPSPTKPGLGERY